MKFIDKFDLLQIKVGNFFFPFIGEREGNGEETQMKREKREGGTANSRKTLPFTSLSPSNLNFTHFLY
jgi:hypothetical protein